MLGWSLGVCWDFVRLKVFPNNLEKEVESSKREFAGDGVALNSYDEDEVGGTAERHDEVQ